MTPRIEELHMLSLDQSFLPEQHAATAVCSCGAEGTITGQTRADLAQLDTKIKPNARPPFGIVLAIWSHEHRRTYRRPLLAEALL